MSEIVAINEKVLKYEHFLNDTLKEDLRKIQEQQDKIYAEIAEYLQLKITIERMQTFKLTEKPLKTKVDLGCNFYVNAKVQDTRTIFVKIGFGFFLELTLAEAVDFIKKRAELLEKIASALSKDSAKVKANIKIVLEGLRELQMIDSSPSQDPPHRDIL